MNGKAIYTLIGMLVLGIMADGGVAVQGKEHDKPS